MVSPYLLDDLARVLVDQSLPFWNKSRIDVERILVITTIIFYVKLQSAGTIMPDNAGFEEAVFGSTASSFA